MKLAKLLREPLVHFTVIGVLIYGLFAIFNTAERVPDEKKIVISSAHIEVFKNTFQKRWNRAPTSQELNGMIQQYIEESVLYQLAVDMGLDQNDSVIRRRLADKMKFLVEDLSSMLEPDQETLRTWFDSNKTKFKQPPRYTFTQIFIDPDKRGDASLDDANQLKTTLANEAYPPANLSELGDGLMLQNYYPDKTPLQIRKQFGSGFTSSLQQLTQGQWHGPVLSGFGIHLVYIEKITPESIPAFATVQNEVKDYWLNEQRERLNSEFYEQLLSQYEIVIDGEDNFKARQSSQELPDNNKAQVKQNNNLAKLANESAQ